MSLVNMEISSREVSIKLASTCLTGSRALTKAVTVTVMTSLRALKQGEKLYVKKWRVAVEKRKLEHADDELAGVVVQKKSKGKGKNKSKSSKAK